MPLQRLSDDELVAEHDELAKETQIAPHTTWTNCDIDDRSGLPRVEKFTRVILWLTVVVTLATIVNVGLVVMAQ